MPRKPRERSQKTTERYQLALVLKSKGYSNNRIARELDCSAAVIPYMIERAAAADLNSPEVARAVILANIRSEKIECWEIINKTNYRTTVTGQLVRGPTGEYLTDDSAKIAAIQALNKLDETEAKILGLIIKRTVTLTVDMIDDQIRQLEAEIETRRNALPLPPPEPHLRAITARAEPPDDA